MRNIVLSIQNGLLAEAIAMALKKTGNFRVYTCMPAQAGKVPQICRTMDADILMMDVSTAPGASLPQRLLAGESVRRYLPACRQVLMCDDSAYPELARQVMLAKQDGRIDEFFYCSVTASYLVAMLEAV